MCRASQLELGDISPSRLQLELACQTILLMSFSIMVFSG